MSTDDRLDVLATTEEHLIPADLRAAAEFLRRARNPGEGWGDYPGVPTDLQVTAQVIGALHSLRHPKTKELTASTAEWAQRLYGERPPSTVQDAVGLLVLAAADQDTVGRYPEELRSHLHAAMAEPAGGQVSTMTLAQAVLAAEHWPDKPRKRIQPWVDELARRGQGSDAWHRAGMPEESLPVTSLAVRALAPWKHRPAAAAAVRLGLEHLRSHLLRDGWESRALSGTYVLTLVLRALATDATSQPDLFDAGIDVLRSRQRPDGGWSGGSSGGPDDQPGGEPHDGLAADAERGGSSVEHTAAAVTALAEAGACRYVPLLDARSAVRGLTASLDEVTKRQTALEEDVDAQVEERLGRVLADRQQLRRRVNELESELGYPRGSAMQGGYQGGYPQPSYGSAPSFEPTLPVIVAPSRPRSWLRRQRFLFAAILVLLGAGTGLSVIAVLGEGVTPLFLAVQASFVALATAGFSVWRRISDPPSESLGSVGLPRIVNRFMDATVGLPASTREELVYRLAREGSELPPDLFLRSLTELTSKQLRLDPATDRRLTPWMEEFARLTPDDRRAVVARLRRTVL